MMSSMYKLFFDFHLSADDSKLFYSHKDLHHLEQYVIRELGELMIGYVQENCLLTLIKHIS